LPYVRNHLQIAKYENTQEKLPSQQDELSAKLEAFGYDVGYRFAERFSREKMRLSEPLEVIKFLCKDFWIQIFKKQIDKLQTNHRVYNKQLYCTFEAFL